MATNSAWLPQLEALLASAPAGVNPFTWYLQRVSDQVGGPQATWAKPIFIIIAVVAFLNVLASIFTLTLRYRQDGSLPLYKMRDHQCGRNYICLNSTNVFLFGHLITSIVAGLYAVLHITYFNKVGKIYLDLSWATMMWLAPFLTIFFISMGVFYGVMVAPTPLTNITRTGDDSLQPPKAPLANLPCWLLNPFIFLVPILVIVSILIPAIKLVLAAKQAEMLAIRAASDMAAFGVYYDNQAVPSVDEQSKFLQTVQGLMSSVKKARVVWRPTFAAWSTWCALAGVLTIIAFVAVNRVTYARLVFARKQQARDFDMSIGQNSSDIFQEKPRSVTTAPISKAVSEARSDYITLSVQFGMAAVLLLICEVMLLWNTVVGYNVHLKSDLLATAVLVPPIAYFLHATTSLAFMISRALRSIKTSSSVNSSPATPAFLGKFSDTQSRQNSEASLLPTRRSLRNTFSKNRDTGRVTVSENSGSYGIAPSMIHQVEVTQTVEISADDPDFEEGKSNLGASRPSFEALGRAIGLYGANTPPSTFAKV